MIEHGEFKLGQSVATASYAAELGLWASGRLGEAVAVNRATDMMVIATHADLQSDMYACLFGDDAGKAAGLVALPAKAAKFLAALERMLERKKTAGPYFFSQSGPSLADLAVFDNVMSPFPGLKALGIDLAPYPKLLAVVAAVGEDALVK